MQSVPNPATPRHLRPVDLITDRAKRYRANQTPPEGPRQCGFCGARRPRDIDHIDGDESNGARRNLQYLCRACNTRKGITQRNQGAGQRTRQYNPARPTFQRYVDAVMILRGDIAGDARHAAQVLQATSPEARREFVKRIWQARTSKRNPGDRPPTFAEYCAAVAMHGRRSHDAGGRVIHATPQTLRHKYAQEIARLKKQRRQSVPF